jgi:hypothetical protein
MLVCRMGAIYLGGNRTASSTPPENHMRRSFIALVLATSLAACAQSPTDPAAPVARPRHADLATVQPGIDAAAPATPQEPARTPVTGTSTIVDDLNGLIR